MVSEASNKVILITGGSSGLGRTATKRFLGEGYTVVITDRTNKKLEEAEEWNGHQKHTRPHFLYNCNGPGKLRVYLNAVDSFKALELPLDILLNNAGRSTLKREYGQGARKVEKLSLQTQLDHGTCRYNWHLL